MFNRICKVCTEKDRALLHLEDEVKFLRSMLSPQVTHAIPEVLREADAVLSGHQGDAPLSEEEQKKAALELVERDMLLAGTY